MANTPEEWRWTDAHAQKLRDVRRAKGLSQKQVAASLGVSDDTLRNWENGVTQPREASLVQIADFCGLSLAELLAIGSPPPSPNPPQVPDTRPEAVTPNRRGKQWSFVAVGVVVVGLAFWYRRGTADFSQIRPTGTGIEAVSRSGRRLWTVAGVDPSVADRWALVRMPGGRKLVACVLARRGDYRPEAVSTLSFLEPNSRTLHVVRTVQLPSHGWQSFPGYSRRYELAYLNALDLDGDGIDEVIATYQQVPECVSYTILYEPAVDRARLLIMHSGAHHFTGAWDLDGDGQRELLFLGINNGYNWMNALAALRVMPAVGSPLQPDTYPVTSPDSATYVPRESALLFYTLLPRGKVPDDPAAVSWDIRRRAIDIRLLNGRVITVSARGFLNETATRPESQRSTLKRDAYAFNREGRRLMRAAFMDDAIAECRKAVAAAEGSGDTILLEAMQRDLVKALIRGGHTAEGESLGIRLAAESENASEIYYDLAAAFHLAGHLRQAVTYYETGMRRGGSPEAGKSKHEFIQGEILALAELGAFDEAERAIDRFRARYVAGAEDWSAQYREFIRWRKGGIPEIAGLPMPWNATDLQRYWMLEFANARGQAARKLLRSVDVLLVERNNPRPGLLSLRAVLLDRMKNADAAAVAREALFEAERDARNSIIARGHLPIVAERYRAIAGVQPD